MTNLFISLYPFYFIILAAKTATQITNTDIILPNLKTRLFIQIILVRRKQRRLNGKYVYIIISFLLHYSGCQNRHANYKHNTSNLKTRLCYIIRVPQKQRRLNDESVYIIISFLLHYSGCQNRHANYKKKKKKKKKKNKRSSTLPSSFYSSCIRSPLCRQFIDDLIISNSFSILSVPKELIFFSERFD